jgi:hypothetical protein
MRSLVTRSREPIILFCINAASAIKEARPHRSAGRRAFSLSFSITGREVWPALASKPGLAFDLYPLPG